MIEWASLVSVRCSSWPRLWPEIDNMAPNADGVCAMVDTFATGVVRAVRESGRAVPGDVRVATRYDGIRARTCETPLTAIGMHLPETAAAAVTLLLQVMSAGTRRQRWTYPCRCWCRASSAVVTRLAR
jgi:DNA-binding LacI/PurR family transcriptional regulator